jgi:tRNA G10  N-methylase Trm11
MSILNYTTNNRAEASVGNVSYILRDDAVACWSTHNIEEVKTKTDALSYAEKRAFEENLTPLWGAAERRNHHRLQLTYANETNPETALQNAKIFLENNFPNARIIYSSHKNTENCHVHAWIDIRQTDGKKVHLKNNQFYKLGESWSKYCDEIYKTNYTEQFKQSRKQHNQEKKKGIEPPKAKQGKKLKEAREKNEQQAINGTKSLFERASRAINESARKIEQFNQIKSVGEHYRNESELARIGREGSERKRRSNAQQSANRIQPPQTAETKSTPNRHGKSEPSQNRSVVTNSRSTI